jgi:hypothetical protein
LSDATGSIAALSAGAIRNSLFLAGIAVLIDVVVGFVAAVPPGPRGSTGSRTATEWTSPAGWRLAWEC